ncbi:hypothetical protein CLV40_123103 [Actinokineospora auranticolor]|uniref:Uncharacterized protein n=1 Tax=Actinokineospora auranticolor TaxID=155976 RepID=A0A2S6GFI9_9PSEU|nr:hypothetical protein CLV40_123103 [Actinokineospora auranticolor]
MPRSCRRTARHLIRIPSRQGVPSQPSPPHRWAAWPGAVTRHLPRPPAIETSRTERSSEFDSTPIRVRDSGPSRTGTSRPPGHADALQDTSFDKRAELVLTTGRQDLAIASATSSRSNSRSTISQVRLLHGSTPWSLPISTRHYPVAPLGLTRLESPRPTRRAAPGRTAGRCGPARCGTLASTSAAGRRGISRGAVAQTSGSSFAPWALALLASATWARRCPGGKCACQPCAGCGPGGRAPPGRQTSTVSISFARRRKTARVCSWHTRDSVTPRTRPISARVRFSK